MKYYRRFLILFLIALSGSAKTQNSDTLRINKVIEKYIDGWRTGDINLLKEAFDLEAGIVLWVDKKSQQEKLNSMKLSNLTNEVKPHEGFGINFEIKQLDIVDSKLAMAKVKIPQQNKDSYYIDYLQLQKINEKWRIVMKSFVHFPKN